MRKYRVARAGLFGAKGAVEVGTEFQTRDEIPAGMAHYVEEIKGDVEDAKPVTNPQKAVEPKKTDKK